MSATEIINEFIKDSLCCWFTGRAFEHPYQQDRQIIPLLEEKVTAYVLEVFSEIKAICVREPEIRNHRIDIQIHEGAIPLFHLVFQAVKIRLSSGTSCELTSCRFGMPLNIYRGKEAKHNFNLEWEGNNPYLYPEHSCKLLPRVSFADLALSDWNAAIEGRGTDATLTFTGGEVLRVHKQLLGLRSKYFHQLFHSGMREETTSSARFDADFSLGMLIIKFLYAAELPKDLDFSTYVELYRKAHMYEFSSLMISLRSIFSERLSAGLSHAEMASLIGLSLDYEDDYLEKVALFLMNSEIDFCSSIDDKDLMKLHRRATFSSFHRARKQIESKLSNSTTTCTTTFIDEAQEIIEDKIKELGLGRIGYFIRNIFRRIQETSRAEFYARKITTSNSTDEATYLLMRQIFGKLDMFMYRGLTEVMVEWKGDNRFLYPHLPKVPYTGCVFTPRMALWNDWEEASTGDATVYFKMGETMKVHKDLLCLRVPRLRGCFSEDSLRLDMNVIPGKEMIKFLYTGQILEKLEPDEYFEINRIAEDLQISNLQLEIRRIALDNSP